MARRKGSSCASGSPTAIRAESDYFEGPYWQFDLDNPVNALDAYEVMIHSHDGHIIYICGPGEGNG